MIPTDKFVLVWLYYLMILGSELGQENIDWLINENAFQVFK